MQTHLSFLLTLRITTNPINSSRENQILKVVRGSQIWPQNCKNDTVSEYLKSPSPTEVGDLGLVFPWLQLSKRSQLNSTDRKVIPLTLGFLTSLGRWIGSPTNNKWWEPGTHHSLQEMPRLAGTTLRESHL